MPVMPILLARISRKPVPARKLNVQNAEPREKPAPCVSLTEWNTIPPVSGASVATT